ncbi:MAG: hypothetical protein JJ992_27625, partial [Planctomycetes bacterium]|nr:hypothetical protein [Planctomycetota bacterium]
AESFASVNTLLRSKQKGGTIALGFTDLTSQAIVSSDSTITAGGSFAATSDGTKQMNVTGSAIGLKGAKTTFSFNYGQSLADVTAAIDGQVAAVGDVRVESQLATPSNFVSSFSQAGLGAAGAALGKVAINNRAPAFVSNTVSNFIGGLDVTERNKSAAG